VRVSESGTKVPPLGNSSHVADRSARNTRVPGPPRGADERGVVPQRCRSRNVPSRTPCRCAAVATTPASSTRKPATSSVPDVPATVTSTAVERHSLPSTTFSTCVRTTSGDTSATPPSTLRIAPPV